MCPYPGLPVNRRKHVLAAAKHAELYPCLIKLLRQREGDLDELFPYHASISMAQMMLSVWDGDADALFNMIEHADLEECARWALFDVLTRLTFDRSIARERTVDFLARFESAPLADDDWSPVPERTAWGVVRRLRPPLVVEGAPLHWDRPASPLGVFCQAGDPHL